MGDRRPGDWDCPKCDDLQFARNTECRKCGEPKPRDGGGRDRYDDRRSDRYDDRRSDRDRDRGGYGGGRGGDDRELCGDYKRGNCHRDQCRYSHGGDSQEPRRGGGGRSRSRSRDRRRY